MPYNRKVAISLKLDVVEHSNLAHLIEDIKVSFYIFATGRSP